MNESIIRMIQSPDYKERFRGEFYELVIRSEKLAEMIHKYKAGELGFAPTCDIELLEDQLAIMMQYRGILADRAEIENIDISLEVAN